MAAIALLVPAAAGANVFSELDEPATIESGPTISIATDKADYAPGELVTVTGSGWQPGENVALSVVDDGVAEERFQYDAVVTADDNGDIVDRFNIAEWYVAQYNVTATGEFSGVATTTFTDSISDYRVGTTAVGGASACTNPGNALTSDDLRANCLRNSADPAQSVVVSGFNLASIVPVGATNIRFNVEVEANKGGGGGDRAVNIALSHNAGTNFTTGATNTPTFAPGADQTLRFPASATNCDDFGRTWSQSELSDANFRLRAMPAGATQATAFIDIDRIRIRVCYDGSNLAEAAAAAQLTAVASPSATVQASLRPHLQGTTSPRWEGTTYQFDANPASSCVDTPDEGGTAGGNTSPHDFPMTVPAARGTYDITFRAYPTDTCTGTPLVFTLTDGLTVGIFGDSFGINTAENNYGDSVGENGWTDGDGAGQDCRVESVAGVGVIDADRFLRLRNGCTQTKSSISTSGLTNIHLKYRWGQDTTVASPGSLTVEWKKSSDGGWTNVNTHPLANSGGTATIPNSVDASLGATANNTSIDIRFIGPSGAASPDSQRGLVDDVIVTSEANTATIEVAKNFVPDNPSGSVTVGLTCTSGTVTVDDASASESDDADFTVTNFTAGATCNASEGSAPAGYSKNEADCQNIAVGSDPGCTITNTTTTTITVDKDFSDDGSGEVTVALTCDSGTVTDTDNTATESDDAEFKVEGFTPGDTCDASEGSAPAGYSNNESDCQDLVLGTDTSCQIVNTTTTTITVDKDFSDDGSGEVTVTLTCESGTVTDTDNTATESDDAEFKVDGFTPGDTCDASEGAAPTGYSKNESDCQDLVLGTETSCQIVNTTTTTITVDKDFSDDGSGEVTITLTCESGTVTDTDNTATESDDAEFKVDGFTPGDTCDASEGAAPTGYSKNESDCQDLVLGTETSCQIVNTTTTTITVDKDFSDDGSGEVTITLTCESGTVTDTDNTATESDDAEFKVDGFTPGDACDASEGPAPAGYSKNESDCEDLVLGTDTSCQIVNTTTTTITVDKDFSDDGTGEVTVTLTCDSGTVTDTDNTATESDDAEFKVDGFTPGDTCDASEGSAPTGYSKNESDCQDLVLGTDTSCQIVNTTTTTITVDKDFSDDGFGQVTILLTCESGTVTDTDNTATETDDAEFKVDGFTPGDTCDASEGPAPTGYSKNESDCEDLVLGTDTSCQIVNTTTTTITVDKDFSDDGSGEVTVTLTCDSGTVTDTDNTATESDDAEFKVDGFTPGDECDASEGAAPSGYSKNEGDCQDLVLGTDTSCQIVNTTTTTITVDKDFSDDGSGEVTVTLTCESGTVTDTDNTATETDDAEFKVDGFTPGDTCDASEGTAPTGYSKNEGDCQDLVLGTDTSCQIVNTTTTTITVDKDFSDDGSGEVTVTLTCESGTVTDTDNTATESDDAEFKVDGFTPGDTCDASEGSAPSGYSKNEADCQDLVLGTDTSCQIVNTTTTTITVDKDFSDNASDEVTITLTCESGDVTNTDNTATETDDAEFKVDDFSPGDTCDASEGTAPTGYTKDESDCQNLVLGTDTSCEVENELNEATITVDKDFSDNASDEVTITLTCESGDVTNTDNTATETDDAEFKVEGFTIGDTCDASEGAAPSGYTKDESDCQNLVLGTDTSCEIENELNEATITVDKDFSDNNSTGEVTVSLTCESGDVTDTDNTATESDDAEFKVEGFTIGDMCDASEGSAPSGYTKDESDCQDLVLGTDTSCKIVNTLNEANITVSKQYSDSNTNAVSVTLTCEGGTVGGSNPRNVAPGSPQTFHVTGFDTGDTCDASESPVPAGYAQDNTDCQDVILGTKTACTINNVTALTLVTQGGCTFDRNTSRNLRQFPLIYTPDGSASGHKLNASNPGQFFMNAAYGGSATSIQIKIPYPFVTVGANPVKVYDGVTTTNASKTCFAPDNLVKSQTDQVTWNWNTDSFASTPKTITVTKPANAFVYVRIHLTYGLKGVAGNCAKTGTTDPFTASCSSPAVTISGYKTYQFSFTGGAVTPTDTIESYNVFKKNPGIGGLVLQAGTTAPIGNTKAEVWQSNKKMADLYTDEDGWYMWSYKYTGKAASFTVKLPAYNLSQSVTLKANGYLSVPFTTP